MTKRTAAGAIGMLLTLLIISLLFILMMPALKDVGGVFNLSGESLNKESVEKRVNDQVKEIENIRSQTSVDINRAINQEY